MDKLNFDDKNQSIDQFDRFRIILIEHLFGTLRYIGRSIWSTDYDYHI